MTTTKATLEDVLNILTDEGECSVRGFGKFRLVERPAHQGRNPKTGKPVEIPAFRTITFKPSKMLRGRL